MIVEMWMWSKKYEKLNASHIYFSLKKLPQSQVYVMMWWVLPLSVVGNSEYWITGYWVMIASSEYWSPIISGLTPQLPAYYRPSPFRLGDSWTKLGHRQGRLELKVDILSTMLTAWAQNWQLELKVDSRSSKLTALVQSWQFELKVESLRCWLTAWPQIWQLELKVDSLS